MSNNRPTYLAAREQLISFLLEQGYKAHPNEVFCPSTGYCWVDVAALKSQEYWAFEYKSRHDSIRRGLEQCSAYAQRFNYVVLVADRFRVTSSPYFTRFRRAGFGIWRHDGTQFYQILRPKRRAVSTHMKTVIERQFRRILHKFAGEQNQDAALSMWFQPSRSGEETTVK